MKDKDKNYSVVVVNWSVILTLIGMAVMAHYLASVVGGILRSIW